MKFLIEKFNAIQKLNPHWSTYVCFIETIKSMPNINVRTMRKGFNVLVDKDDYARSEKDTILDFLQSKFLTKI